MYIDCMAVRFNRIVTHLHCRLHAVYKNQEKDDQQRSITSSCTTQSWQTRPTHHQAALATRT